MQVLAIMVVGTISAVLFLEEGVVASFIDISKLTPWFVCIMFIYFILGYSLFSLLYALVGSSVSKPEDINSANSPIAILAVLGFYFSYFSMMNPIGGIAIAASTIPISSPFSMPFRVMLGTATGMQIAISLAVLIVTILILAKVSIKVYSLAILNYGTKLKIKDMFKIYKDK